MKYFIFICFLFLSTTVFSQQTDYVNFQKLQADLNFEDGNKISGVVTVAFKIVKDVDSIYLDAVQMEVKDLKLSTQADGAAQVNNYRMESDKIIILNDFKKNTEYLVQFSYQVAPKKALYFVDDQIWTQGQGKYTSHWLPSINDMNEKIEFDLSISYDDAYIVLANGKLKGKEALANNRLKWHYDMKSPMSSYLVALVIGKYDVKTETSKTGIPLEYYFYPPDSAKVESTYRYSKQMFDFMENEIGVAYPWEVYRQVPVKDFLYSGMENTTLTIFSDALVVDPIEFNDQNYVNVNAHELAHQWFGNLVTATSGSHHWLQEGFATYYALLAEREVFGEDHFYWELYASGQQLLSQENAGESTSLMDPKSSSVTFYQKGSWALHILREQVGAVAFRSAVKNYLEKYQYKNVETSNFIREVEKESGQDLSDFVQTWIEDAALPQDDMVQSFKKSAFIQEYLDVSCETYPAKCADYLVSNISDKAKIKIISQDSYVVKLEDFNNSNEVRLAIAEKMTTIPIELKEKYETLLSDKSYKTIEVALYNLWVNFPTDRAKYLQKTKGVSGFSDMNVKLLWLALHLNTMEYQPDKKQAILEELRGYTDASYSSDLQMNAFRYLKLIRGFDKVSIMNLIDATQHHNWRFQKFSKQSLEELEKDPKYKEIMEKIEN